MAKIEARLKCELDPFSPVNEVLQVIDAMISNNRLHEKEILLGINEAIETRLAKIEMINKGVDANGKPVRRDNGN